MYQVCSHTPDLLDVGMPIAGYGLGTLDRRTAGTTPRSRMRRGYFGLPERTNPSGLGSPDESVRTAQR